MNAALDGVAIVGMAGRFPGAASIDEYWRNLAAGRESITHFDAAQLSRLVPAAQREHPRHVAARGIIADAARFDAEFFGIGAAEALLMDPQQRVFLELCWNALEHAALDPRRYAGSIGVYAGVSNNGYRKLLETRPDLIAASGEFAAMLANEKDYVATRVAHRLGLTGPAISIHTACSTSLVAIAQAWYALMSWQCDAALAGGINIVVPQESGYVPVDGGMESADGSCRPFDAAASGTLFSSGGGVVVLKRLADAIADRDMIWAVIRGVGVNNDGADKASFTAPSARGQAAVIRLALASANIDAATVGYVEAHGTGTALGDPIEVDALTRAFRADTDARTFCWLGSVKGNIGHLVGGAGVAGLIKTVLALHHERIPPTLHYRHANPEIDFGSSPFKVADRTVDWPRGTQPRRAGVSSFGVGGTNAHAILEEAPPRAAPAAPPRAATLLVLSARDAAALQRRASDLAAALGSCTDGDMADIGWTLAVGRRAMPARCAFVARSAAQARDALHQVRATAAQERPRIVFLFPGQGSQHLHMARGLVRDEPVFAAAFGECCALATAALNGEDLQAAIHPAQVSAAAAAALQQTRLAQPALFAVEYALARLWQSWGITPAAMIGHSIGEYVAACLAGVFPLAVAIRLVVARAAAMQAQPGGAMLAVRCSRAELEPRLPPGIDIAAFNASDAIVVAGGEVAIDTLARELAAARIASTRLQVSHAFHSAAMDGAQALFRLAFDGVALHAPQAVFYSCVSGRPITGDEATSPDYWCRQLRAPVRFDDAVTHALALPDSLALEVGPGHALSAQLRRQPALRERAVASLQSGAAPDADDGEQLAAALGELWCRGAVVDWERYWIGAERRRIALPGYPFHGPLYWVDPVELEAKSEAPAARAMKPAVVAGGADAARRGVRELIGSIGGMTLTPEQDQTRFLDLGLDSLGLTQTALELENRHGLRLNLRRLVDEVDTVDKLAALLAASGAAAAAPASAVAATAPDAAPAPIAGADAGATPDADAKPFGAQARIARSSAAPLDERQREWLDAFTRRYVARTRQSKEFSERHRDGMADPRVVTGFNPLWKELVYPIVADRSVGPHLWDIDGNRYVDLLNAFGANLLGYQPESVKQALLRQVEAGFEIGPQHPLAADVAALIRDMTGVERVAFCNTGSEAVMGAMRIARTVTGRKTIVIFRHSYHGIFDEVIVRGTRQLRSIAAAPGILANAVENILVLDYGAAAALEVIRERAGSLAAVMIEPVQSRDPGLQPREFVQALREICDANGCALIFDEVITGFRVGPGGAQEFYGVRADIATYGKVIGGGLPLAAIAGRRRWLDALDGGAWRFGDDSRPEAGVTYFAGTFVRHPLALAAGKATLEYLRQRGPGLQQELNRRTRDMAQRLDAFFAAHAAPMRMACFSSLWSVRIDRDQPLADLFYYALRERGLHVYAQFNCFLTTAHGAEQVEQICAAIEAATVELLDAGILRRKSVAAPAGSAPVAASPPGAAKLQAAAVAADATGVAALPAQVRPTDAQTEKWLACQFGDTASIAFNESQLLLLHGDLDRPALERTIMQVCARHEAFAISFAPDGSALRVGPIKAISPAFVDLEGGPGAAGLQAHCAAAMRRPFDLTRAPLARIELIRLAPREHALLVVAHHLVFDGWSAAVFLTELATVYRAAVAGRDAQLAPAQSFRAFALAERERGASAAVRAQIEYWTRVYATRPDALDLPTDRPRPHQPNFAAATSSADLPAPLTAALRQLARHCGVTLYSVLLAAFAALLARLSGQRDFAIGIPFASQARAGRHAMIGDGVNTLPLRLHVDPDQAFAALAQACHRALLDAADNQDLTSYTLLGALDRQQRDGHGALSDVIFNLNPRIAALDFGGLEHSVRDCPKPALIKDLFFNLNDLGDQVTLDVHYRTALFDAATIVRWTGHFQTLLDNATNDPQQAVAALALSDAEQLREVLAQGQSPRRVAARHETLPDLVFAQAARSPDRCAVVAQGQALNYAELARRARAIAQALLRNGVQRGESIGICLPRGNDMVAALLGIMAAGAAYLPLDPSYPDERLRGMASRAGMRRVVTNRHREFGAGLPGDCVRLDVDELMQREAEPGELPALSGAAPAYILYTSGSTGEPKGVRVLQRNLVNCLLSMREQPGIVADDVLCAVTPLSFDIAALELYLPLLVGARVVIASEQERRDPDLLVALLREHAATVLQTTPSWLRVLAGNDRLRNAPRLKLLVGGEELPRNLAEAVLPQCRELWNLYGPTEATIWATVSRVVSGEGSVPIGRPIANTHVHVLDARQQLLPLGARGEIWIGGAGVADGYIGDPALSAERFRADPFAPGEMMYRSGDIGSWKHGQLHFHGRIDDQIKLRGFRIEPGEIEAAACALPEVSAAVAAVCPVGSDERRLVLYVIAPGAVPTLAADIRERLRRRLPPHMVPQHIEVLDALPQTAHGKIDRNSLPPPRAQAPRSDTRVDTPHDRATELLLEIWRDLLGTADVDPDSNFFDLGGDSLLGVELFQRAHARTGVNLPLATLLTAQTVREQALLFRGPVARASAGNRHGAADAASGGDPWSPLVKIQDGTARPPLFCIHALGGNVLNYVPLARALGDEQPVYGVQAIGLDGVTSPLTSIEAMAQRYLQEIRSLYPQGPYYLCGGSMGGLIALEIAQRLQADAQQVAFLGLFDTYGPGNGGAQPAGAAAPTHWQERWMRLRTLGPRARAAMIIDGVRRRLYRGADALQAAWYRWRRMPLPHGVRYRELERLHLIADESYRPRPYRGMITLFRARQQPARSTPSWALGWETIALDGIRVVHLPGSHDTLIEQPDLARALRTALQRAQGDAQGAAAAARRVG